MLFIKYTNYYLTVVSRYFSLKMRLVIIRFSFLNSARTVNNENNNKIGFEYRYFKSTTLYEVSLSIVVYIIW